MTLKGAKAPTQGFFSTKSFFSLFTLVICLVKLPLCLDSAASRELLKAAILSSNSRRIASRLRRPSSTTAPLAWKRVSMGHYGAKWEKKGQTDLLARSGSHFSRLLVHSALGSLGFGGNSDFVTPATNRTGTRVRVLIRSSSTRVPLELFGVRVELPTSHLSAKRPIVGHTGQKRDRTTHVDKALAILVQIFCNLP